MRAWLSLAAAATAFGLFWLVWILWTTLENGVAAMNLQLFTRDDAAAGLRRRPAERDLRQPRHDPRRHPARHSDRHRWPAPISPSTREARRIGEVIRFVNDILLSAPSIVLGLFVYTLVVRQIGHFSGWAGALALAFIRAAGGRAHHRRDAAAGAVPMREAALAARRAAMEGHDAGPATARRAPAS